MRPDAPVPGRATPGRGRHARRRAAPSPWPGRLRELVAFAFPPLLGGLAVAASLPPFGLWPLGPAGIALLAWSSAGRSWRGRLAVGVLFGLGQLGVGDAWALRFTGAGYAALVAIEAAFFGLAAVASPPGRGRLPALAGLLTLAEWARDSWPFGGAPLGGIALGQASGPLLPVARLGGPLLVAAAAFLAGTALAALLGGAGTGRWRGQPGTSKVVVHAALGGLAALGGIVALGLAGAVAPDGGPALRLVPAAAVQGGGPRGLRALDVPAAGVLAAQLRATRDLRPGARLVVWPEDVVALDRPLAGSPAERLLGRIASGLGATLVAGVTEPAGPGRFRNEAAVFDPSGRLIGTYEKVHPVPFGEYVPLRSLLSHVVSFAAVPRDAVFGHGTGMVATPVGRLGILISYETFFPSRGRAPTRAGARLLLVPTNTASYTTDQVPAQELAASRLQAVSEGRDLVQAATDGYSAVIGPSGRVLERSRLGGAEDLRATVALRAGATVYERLGDLPVLVAAAVASVSGWLGALAARRRRRRRDTPTAGSVRTTAGAPIGVAAGRPASVAPSGAPELGSEPAGRSRGEEASDVLVPSPKSTSLNSTNLPTQINP